MNKEYLGIYDHKESDTFRPTAKSRIHKDMPTSKTLTCREDSCCVIEAERERNGLGFVSSHRWNALNLWVLLKPTILHFVKLV